MLIRTLRKFGVTSDMMFAATGGSILTSIIAWRVRSGDNFEHAERLGIFIGLWAPTFAVLGTALKSEEDNNNTRVDPVGAVHEVRATAQDASQKVKEAVA